MRPLPQESPYLTGSQLQHSRLNEDIGKALDAHHELVRSLSERLTTPRASIDTRSMRDGDHWIVLLGRVDVFGPDAQSGEFDKGQERSGGLIVTGCDTSEPLQLRDEPLDAVARPISCFIMRHRLAPVLLGRNDGQGPMQEQVRA